MVLRVSITRNQIHALEFVLNGCFRKIFRTSCNDIVHECMSMFNVLSPESAIAKRKCKFLSNVVASGTLKMQDWKMQDWKMRHQRAGVENAGLEIAAPGKVWNTASVLTLLYVCI